MKVLTEASEVLSMARANTMAQQQVRTTRTGKKPDLLRQAKIHLAMA
jgi:hypothetical protein